MSTVTGTLERRRRAFVLACASLLLLPAVVVADVVINEIHYEPELKSSRLEFVELYNAGGVEVDLSGWFFSDGISFRFPEGTALPPTAFVVVAQDQGVRGSGVGAV
jgi:hypothetical protein